MRLGTTDRRLLRFVATHNAPTMREIAVGIGIKSSGQVWHIVRHLKRLGLVKSDPSMHWDTPFRTVQIHSKARSVRLADDVAVTAKGEVYKIVLDNYDMMRQTATSEVGE